VLRRQLLSLFRRRLLPLVAQQFAQRWHPFGAL
jgi:hypothetical protein